MVVSIFPLVISWLADTNGGHQRETDSLVAFFFLKEIAAIKMNLDSSVG